jgi:hypothetical protein
MNENEIKAQEIDTEKITDMEGDTLHLFSIPRTSLFDLFHKCSGTACDIFSSGARTEKKN